MSVVSLLSSDTFRQEPRLESTLASRLIVLVLCQSLQMNPNGTHTYLLSLRMNVPTAHTMPLRLRLHLHRQRFPSLHPLQRLQLAEYIIEKCIKCQIYFVSYYLWYAIDDDAESDAQSRVLANREILPQIISSMET